MTPPEPRADRASDAGKRLADEALSASWLSTRLGVEPERLHAMRRAGQLLAVRPGGTGEHLFPLWQFGDDGKPLPCVSRVVEAARASGLDSSTLYEVMTRRIGLRDTRRLVDVMREGGCSHVLAAIRSAAP